MTVSDSPSSRRARGNRENPRPCPRVQCAAAIGFAHSAWIEAKQRRPVALLGESCFLGGGGFGEQRQEGRRLRMVDFIEERFSGGFRKRRWALGRNKVPGLAFVAAHSSSKKRSMNGAQFHPPWGCKAGGGLTRNAGCAGSGSPKCHLWRRFLNKFSELASAPRTWQVSELAGAVRTHDSLLVVGVAGGLRESHL